MVFDFLPTQVTPAAIVLAARAYEGLKYSRAGTWCHTGPGGRIVGQCDCAGLFLLVARRLDLLPASFDPNLPPQVTGVSREEALLQILTRNFERIEIADLQPGDLLSLRYPEHGDLSDRHLAIFTSTEPAPRGSMLHALNSIDDNGSVFEQPIDVADLGRIQKVYRLKPAFLLEGHG